MVRGIRAMNEWSFNGAEGQTTDPHTQVVRVVLHLPAGDARQREVHCHGHRPLARSLRRRADQPEWRRPALHADRRRSTAARPTPRRSSRSISRTRSFRASGHRSRSTAASRTSSAAGATSPDTYKVARGNSIIDIVRDDLSNLQRVPMSSSDQQKLSDWARASAPDVQAVIARGAARTHGVGGHDRHLGGREGGDRRPTSRKSRPVMTDLAVLTAHLRCEPRDLPEDAAELRVQLLEPDGRIPLVVAPDRQRQHGRRLRQRRHGHAPQRSTPGTRSSSRTGREARRLPEGNGTLLDNTATVWFQEMSDGDSHNLNNLPILQAGSCGGYFKTG